MQTYNKSIKSDNLQLIYKIIHTTYKKSIKTYNPLQEVYNPSLQVVYPPMTIMMLMMMTMIMRMRMTIMILMMRHLKKRPNLCRNTAGLFCTNSVTIFVFSSSDRSPSPTLGFKVLKTPSFFTPRSEVAWPGQLLND